MNHINIDLKEEYKEALEKAWKEYWGFIPPWYANLEEIIPYINKHLGKNLSLEEYLKIIKILEKEGYLEYWYGGIDPKRRHWFKLLK